MTGKRAKSPPTTKRRRDEKMMPLLSFVFLATISSIQCSYKLATLKAVNAVVEMTN